MFTGIVTEVGNVIAIADKGDKRVTVSCAMDPARIAIGASIACSGVCLTVVEKGGVVGEAWFAVDVSGETISRTAPAQWQAGAPINLEPALRLGDELGGHIVTGHVDALGTVVSLAPEGGSLRVIVRPAGTGALYRAQGLDHGRWRVTDGQRGGRPGRRIVPFRAQHHSHTAQITTLGTLAEGRAVNLEIDVLARYLQRMQSLSRQA
jgi:riboflavin synthase